MTIARLFGLVRLGTVLLALSGCAAETSVPPPVDPGTPRPPVATPLPAPTWQVGDRWTYEWASGTPNVPKSI